MTDYVEGLCSTCRYSSKCAFLKESIQDVQFCEEYEADASLRKRKKIASPKELEIDSPYAKGEGDRAARTALGLCRNCDQYPICNFVKTEAGVWHCEEYR